MEKEKPRRIPNLLCIDFIRNETARNIYFDYEKEIKAQYGPFDRIDAYSILEWLKEICEKHGADFENDIGVE